MVFSAILKEVLIDEVGIPRKYRMAGKQLYQTWLQDITKVKKAVVREFLFADDCALNALT